MIIENLITGIAEGWFNSKGKHSTLPFSERHDIEHKNLVLRNPQFEKNNKVDLNQFKIKPFIFLENQDVIIYDKRTKYQLKLDKVVIKNVSIVDASKNIPFERVLFALGIRYVGETVAKKLSKHYNIITS